MKWVLAGAALLAAGAIALAMGRPEEPAAGWWEVTPGIAHRALYVPGGGAAELLRVDLRRTILRVVDARTDTGDRATARAMRERTAGAVVAVNGGFFDPSGAPMGLVLSQGQVTNTLRRADWGVFWVAGDRAGIVHTRDWRDDPPANATEALQAGPRLVVDGRPVQLKPQVARRTVVCTRAPHEVYLVVAEAVGAEVLAAWLARSPARGGLGCKDALNLDGGPSSQLSLGVKNRALEVTGAWPVPNGLVAVPR